MIVSGGELHTVIHADAGALTQSIRQGSPVTSFADGVMLTEQTIAFCLGMVIGVPYSIISLPLKAIAVPVISTYHYFKA